MTEGEGIGTRKQELERLRMRQVNAQKLELQERAEDLLHEADPGNFTVQIIISHSPKKIPLMKDCQSILRIPICGAAVNLWKIKQSHHSVALLLNKVKLFHI